MHDQSLILSSHADNYERSSKDRRSIVAYGPTSCLLKMAQVAATHLQAMAKADENHVRKSDSHR